MTSELPGFYRLPLDERRAKIAALTGVSATDMARLAPGGGLGEDQADRMVENALGVHGLPLGVCANMLLNGRDVLVPMCIEEPSVVAASSYAAKLLRAGGGVQAEISEPICIGQIQVLEVPDFDAAERAVEDATPELLERANSGHPSLVGAGGGAFAIEMRRLGRMNDEDPCGDMLVLHLVVDVRDAMGANAINSMCERLAPRISELTGGRVGLRILSNLTDRRTVTVVGRVPYETLDGQGFASGEELAKRIQEASVFAERDPYRACTHNKGVMNGIDAVLIALGQDFRAVEAGAHAWAARNGRYTALATWRAEDGHLVGRMTLPMAVGTVGGVYRVHPVVQTSALIANVASTAELAAMTAAVGLAQNLGALRALAAEGIQSGHMRLHARNIAAEAGALPHEVAEVATTIADNKDVSMRAALTVLTALREKSSGTGAPIKDAPRLSDVQALRTADAPPVVIAPSRGAADKSKRPPNPPDPQWRVSQFESGPDVASAPRSDAQPNPERRFEGKVLVTGGAGHLGANMVRRLLADGMDVRVLVRPGSDNSGVEDLPVELVLGDLRDAASVARAVQGCETIYHCAANVSTVQASAELEREIFECNVLGTKNLLQSARSASVERVVVTGSFSGIGYDLEDRSKAGNEEMPFYPFEDVLPYARTKMQAEHESLKACVEGLDVVIATSCAIIGPHDYKPSRMGRTLLDYAHGRLHAYIAGGFDFVSTRDLTEGHVLAMRRGRKGQKYIVSTEYQSLDDIMATWEEITGRPRPRVRLPADAMAGVAKVSSFVLGNFFPESPQRFTPAAVRILKKERRADTGKAQRELGYRPTSVRHAFHEAYEDFARRGLVPGRSRIHVSVPARADEAESKSPRKTPSSASRAATGS